MGDRMSAADQEKSGEAKPEEEEEPFSLSAEALKAVKSVGENLSELGAQNLQEFLGQLLKNYFS